MSASESNPPRGGVGTQATPATNSSSGAGLGDSGYPKGNTSTAGQFNTLRNQKSTASRNEHESHAGDPDIDKESTLKPKPNEDSSFMGHKPGHPETLPGWEKLKDFTGYNA